MEPFTVNVFQVSPDESDRDGDTTSPSQPEFLTLDKHLNMMSVRILKGKLLELEHSNLARSKIPNVKFKTVINYERILKPGHCLGVALVRQEDYIENYQSES